MMNSLQVLAKGLRKRAAERIQTADLLTSHLYWCPHPNRIYTYV